VSLGLPPVPPAVVVVIASSRSERVRLASLIDEQAPVLMAARVCDAVAVLGEVSGEMSGGIAGGMAGEVTSPTEPAAPQAGAARGVEVDSDSRMARWGERSVCLAPLEHDMLVRLLESGGHTLTFEELHRDVWGNDHLGDRSDLTSTVKRLRRKLAQLASPLVIQAVRGVGLRLVEGPAAVRVLDPG
jgi:DNA-binding response OmpR family regulator